MTHYTNSVLYRQLEPGHWIRTYTLTVQLYSPVARARVRARGGSGAHAPAVLSCYRLTQTSSSESSVPSRSDCRAMPSDSRGVVVAAVLGTGVTLLWCSRAGVGPQPQTEAREPLHRVESDEQNAYDQPQSDEYQRSNEMMIMSSPRPNMSDTYSDIGLRNSRETPGFIQKAQAAEAERVLHRFSMNRAAQESQPVTFDETDPALAFAAAQRRLLPKRIILVRHGESEANADVSLLRHKPDNLIELTAKGSRQALAVGQRIKKVVGDEKVCLVVSPFERTLQTSRNLRLALDESQIVKTSVEPRLREQVIDVDWRHTQTLIKC